MVDPLEGGGLVLAGGLGAKAVEFVFRRFITRADERELAAERVRDEREQAMGAKLDRIVAELGDLRSEARADRERQSSLVAVTHEVKARIDGISANHGARLGQVEQRLAALSAVMGERMKDP